MTISVQSNNVASTSRFRSLFARRDIFVHDAQGLRRISVGGGIQFIAAFAAFLLVAWSIFAAVQLLTRPAVSQQSAEVARMKRQVSAMRADVEALRVAAEERYDLTEAEIRGLGLDPKRLQGQGGPFEAVEPLKSADPKFKQLFTSWKKLDRIELGTVAIPSSQPVKGTALTSGYGVRSDPFRGRAAMHAGIDLAAPIGTKIYATADGYVQRSEWAGGYGNLVELNHGRGIQTRYGHLSKSLVKAGDRVKRGQLIALMGSTGRSTGSHLHYEVRVDGKAVNPIPFMQSNEYLASVQRRASAAFNAIKTAMGGPEGTK